MKCHYRKPANEMRKKTIQVESGTSLGIYGFGSGKGKARGSVRKHFRNKEVWICDSCDSIRSPGCLVGVFKFVGKICIFLFIGALLIYFFS